MHCLDDYMRHFIARITFEQHKMFLQINQSLLLNCLRDNNDCL